MYRVRGRPRVRRRVFRNDAQQRELLRANCNGGEEGNNDRYHFLGALLITKTMQCRIVLVS